ncbi:hypothetical protein GIB67_008857 [Kingdonia uniflora]|uniref:Retrotransposon Copia-like N-terminal domain-containing protein n=1 Tax=Kingdonia uniflora TaxID=39325 RepID=A0A7J7LV74_9MAGN|nr:hypothetical protein GIB67_008857 [Kingdonia uniflora]
MAIGDESSSSSIIFLIGTSEDVQSFNSVHDNPNLKITSQLLDDLNYVRWAQSAKLFVGGRGKIGFLLGTEKEPVESDPKYAKWFSDDLMVRTWLINFMQSTISVGYLFTNNAHLIWELLRKGTQTLGMHYARLRSSWEELSHYDSFIEWPASAELSHYDSFIEWPASAPSENIPIPPTAAEIYVKIVEKTVRYAYPAPPSVPLQTSHTSSPLAFLRYQQLPATLAPRERSVIIVVYTQRHPGRQPPTPDCQASSVAPGLPPAIDSPLSGKDSIRIQKGVFEQSVRIHFLKSQKNLDPPGSWLPPFRSLELLLKLELELERWECGAAHYPVVPLRRTR